MPASRTQVDTEAVNAAHALLERARSLRSQAARLTEPLAAAYRRRASELELEAFLVEVQAGLPYDEVHAAA